jgi:hypothetical protein
MAALMVLTVGFSLNYKELIVRRHPSIPSVFSICL